MCFAGIRGCVETSDTLLVLVLRRAASLKFIVTVLLQ